MCTPGQSVGCACENGRSGAQICGADSTYGACRCAFCGDGVVDQGEQCDSGTVNSDTWPGACRTTCVAASCGDGVQDPGEGCDEGLANSDGLSGSCRTTCAAAGCGDGIVEADEECDDAAGNSDMVPGACRRTCVAAWCGDGVVDPGESCDQGAANDDTAPGGCRTTCVHATCGDATVDPGEECDDGMNDGMYGTCDTDCTPAPGCGDGVVQAAFEQCDDGAANSDTMADACRTTCALPSCGDDTVDSGEACDDGVENSETTPGACRLSCALPACGDAVVDPAEECDDGVNDGSYGGCQADCSFAPYCGDGTIDPGEECDDGPANTDSTLGACRTTCTVNHCGDGAIDSGEACDDGFADACGDCNASCTGVGAAGVCEDPVTLPFRVLDAEYSRALDRLVAVGTSPNRLYVYDPLAHTYDEVVLSLAPTAVSVGPDGAHAAVGHNGWISYVDLASLSVVVSYPVSANLLDVVLAGNGYAYGFPVSGMWTSIRSLNLTSGVESPSGGWGIYAGTVAKLHPDGTKMYGADNGLSPSDIERYNITAGPATIAYDSPYHGDYAMCGDLWISDDGARIFTRCGNVFWSTDTMGSDMIYGGSLGTSVRHVDHSSASGQVAAVPSAFGDPLADTQVKVYDAAFLTSVGSFPLPPATVSGMSYPDHGRFAFWRSDGSRYYVIVQVDPTAGLLNDYAILTMAP